MEGWLARATRTIARSWSLLRFRSKDDAATLKLFVLVVFVFDDGLELLADEHNRNQRCRCCDGTTSVNTEDVGLPVWPHEWYDSGIDFVTTKADTTDTILRPGIFSISVVVVVNEKDGIEISTQRNSPYENSAILYIGNTAGRCCGTCSDSEGILIVVEMFESAEFILFGVVATTTYSTTRRNSDYIYI